MLSMTYYLQTNIVCIVVLLYLFVYLKVRQQSNAMEVTLFYILIISTCIYCVSDCFTWYANGNNMPYARQMVYLSNIVYIVYTPVMSYLWDDYLCCKSMGVRAHKGIMGKTHLTITILLAIATVSTPLTGLAFTVDSTNLYHRGTIAYLAPLVAGIFILYMTVNYIVVSFRSDRLEDRDNSRMVISFFVPILVTFILQLFLYGTSLIQVGMTLSLLIVLISNQETQISCDELTGLNNRREFNKYVEKLYGQGEDNSICFCLIDADGFKKINDTYGHLEGDRALKLLTEAIKQASRKMSSHWFIARIGGDEFAIVGNVKTENDVIILKQRMKEEIIKVNSESNLPYELGFSFGYAFGILRNKDDRDNLLARADKEMYREKNDKNKKAVC